MMGRVTDDFKMCRLIQNRRRSFLPFLPMLWQAVDASIQDNQVDPALFAFWKRPVFDGRGTGLWGFWPIFLRFRFLSRFKLFWILHECCFCHRGWLPFEYSFRYSGSFVLDHYDCGWEISSTGIRMPLYLLDQFQAVWFSELEISYKRSICQLSRQAIDQLYGVCVGSI